MFTDVFSRFLPLFGCALGLTGCGGLTRYPTSDFERDPPHPTEATGQLFEVQLPAHDALLDATASERFLVTSLRTGDAWTHAIYDWASCEAGHTAPVAEMHTASPVPIDTGSDLVVIGTQVYRPSANGFEEEPLLGLETEFVQHVEVLGHAQVLIIVDDQGHIFAPGIDGWYPTQGLPNLHGTPLASDGMLAVGDQLWHYDEKDSIWRAAGNASGSEFVDVHDHRAIDAGGRSFQLDEHGTLLAGPQVLGRRWVDNGTVGIGMNGLQFFNTDNEVVSEYAIRNAVWFTERDGDRLVLRDDNDTVLWAKVRPLPAQPTPDSPPENVFEVDAPFELGAAELQTYLVDVTAGAARMTVTTTGNGNADLLVNYGSQAQFSSSDCASLHFGSDEVCTFENPQSGTWHISVVGADALSTGRVRVFVDYPTF